ncbi:thioredoxin family protein [Rhodoferax sp. GW822-FHT02A01]|uniref:protein-disulfide reductase DsbD family protein n=1 Tax=Rhodoferax sp. GW822-FHT02A01 TaxID=3141537 RepID=UPI00315D92FE
MATTAWAQFSSPAASSVGGGAVSAVVQTEQVRAELVAYAPDGVSAGKPVWVGLQLTHQPQWHTYWKNAGDSGLPTRLEWSLPAGVTAGEIAWPTPQKINIGSLANFGYEGTVLLPVPLSIDKAFAPSALADTMEVKLSASWLVCKQECVPQDGNFVLQLPLRGSTALHAADFERARAAQPVAHNGKSEVQLAKDGLTVTIAGLPAAWLGKNISAFIEAPDIIETARSPSASDSKPQNWSGDGSWSATLPYSTLRSESPASLAFVLVSGTQSLRTQATVHGTWPPLPTGPAASATPQLTGTSGSAPLPPAKADAGLGTWALAMGAALLGGLILNLMPCVFPVLAIKVLGFTRPGQSHVSHRTQGLAYTAGVVLSFLALGGLMLALRAGGERLGWGFQLQSPAVIAALALLFTLIGLNLMGLLEVGNLLPGKLASLQLRHPVGDAFLSGVLAVAIASPCTAPFMGASLGYAIALPALQALGIFAALGVGLALPFLAISWIPGSAKLLPRPGAWMVTLRRFLAFPMWATVVWLLWVLGHLSGVDGAASLLALLLCLALLVWSLRLSGRSRVVLSAIALLTGIWLTASLGPNVLREEAAASASASAGSAAGAWQPWEPGRVEAELAAGKPVFVDFTAAWCITCQYNKKTTLADATVQADFSAKKVSLLRADWTHRDPAITQALSDLGRSGVPVYVLYQPGKPAVVLSELLGVGELRSALARL